VVDPEFWNMEGRRICSGVWEALQKFFKKFSCRNNAFCPEFSLDYKMHPVNRGARRWLP